MDDLWAGWRSQTLLAGIELEVFSHIAEKKRTVKEIVATSGAPERGMANLLDGLTALGYLRKAGDKYSLEPIAATFLVKTQRSYMGGASQTLHLMWEPWGHLTKVIKTGRPYKGVDLSEQGKEFFPKLVAGLFPGSFAASSAAVASLSPRERGAIKNILDVAAGSAAWSLAFAQAIPEARVTALDYTETIPVTRSFVEKLQLTDRYNYLEGDLRHIDFGRELYDLVILGHIVHSEGAVHGEELIRKSFAALRPGGKLLIADFVPNDARTGPLFPVLFGLNMLIHTEEGNVFTMREYKAWLKAAGFRTVKTIDAPGPSPLILATK
jgi:ubiquinone/menaquinone biosynthesis C-methylase UbiE